MSSGPIVAVILNQPRTVLLRPGWAKSRLAAAMQPAEFSSELEKYVESQLPDDLWKEPNTGVIMLRPSALRSDYWEDSTYEPYRIDATQFNEPGGTMLAVNSNDSILIKRTTAASALISLLATIALNAILLNLQSEMVWVLSSKNPLTTNEGWSVWVHPPGIYTSRATDYMLIAFGDRYVLHIQLNGMAALWANEGTASDPSWQKKTVFAVNGGGVDHTRPFQITCIPWGNKYISFVFSQQQQRSSGLMSTVSVPVEHTYLYNINAHEQNPTSFDNITNQWVKTKAGTLWVGLRRYLHSYGFAWGRVRYATTADLALVPEVIPEPLDQADPTVTARAVFGQKSPADGSVTAISSSFVNEDDTAWAKSTDTKLVEKFTFTATTDRLYTPELWSCDTEIPEKTYTPPWTPEDVSDKWTYVRFQRSVEPDVSICELKLENTDAYPDIMHGWGPLRVEVETVGQFDGYVYSRQPTLEPVVNPASTTAIVVTQIHAKDMWVRLNECPVSDWTFLDKTGVITAITKLIKRAGFLDADIVVTDPDGYLASLEIAGFIDPNDQKTFNQDATVGDALRELLKWFAIRPIRVRWIDDHWSIYLSPEYDPASVPTKKLLLVEGASRSDNTRFTANEYKVLSNLQFTVEEPNFNGLICRTSTTVQEDARSVQSVIPAILGDPDSLSDPASYGFMGRAKYKIVAPPEITLAQTQIELDAMARAYWERNAKPGIILEFEGEWTKDVDADDFIWVIGLDESGARVSYGAYRIDHIDIEYKEDPTGASNDNRWRALGNYTCTYVGTATDGSTPMFTTSDNLPEDP